MRRVLSAVAAVALLLALGAVAVMALPGAQGAAAPIAVSAAAPEAPAVTFKWNAVAMALNATTAIPDAETLSKQVAGVQEVLAWNSSQQGFVSWIPDAIFPPPGGFGTNFPTNVGEPYMLLLDLNAPAVFSIVGDVPDQGSVHFNLAGDATACKWNFISLPLDASTITTAEALSIDIGNGANVEELLVWDATQQSFVSYIPDAKFPPPGGFGTNFETKIGYPYFVCVSAPGVVWP